MLIMNLMAFCPWVTFWETVKDCQPLIFKSDLKQRYEIYIIISTGNFRDKKIKDELRL